MLDFKQFDVVYAEPGFIRVFGLRMNVMITMVKVVVVTVIDRPCLLQSSDYLQSCSISSWAVLAIICFPPHPFIIKNMYNSSSSHRRKHGKQWALVWCAAVSTVSPSGAICYSYQDLRFLPGFWDSNQTLVFQPVFWDSYQDLRFLPVFWDIHPKCFCNFAFFTFSWKRWKIFKSFSSETLSKSM